MSVDNNAIKAVSRVVISIALLVVAWQLVDSDKLLALFSTLDWTAVLIAVAITVPMHVLSALRWQLTCARIGVALRFTDAVREYYLASLLNSVLPGGVGGDASRVWRHGRQQAVPPEAPQQAIAAGPLQRYYRPLHGVLIERFLGQCALFAILAVGLVINQQSLKSIYNSWPVIADVLVVVLAVAMATIIFVVGKRSATIAPSPIGTAPALQQSWLSRSRALLYELRADVTAALTPFAVFLAQALLSLAVVATYLLIFWYCAQALHASLSATTALLAIPLVLTAMTIPLSVGGLGLRESAAALIWPLLSMPASDGVAVALLYGAVVLAGSLPGIAVLLVPNSCAMTKI